MQNLKINSQNFDHQSDNQNKKNDYFIILLGLLHKETHRFLIIYHQTILSPIISSFMFVLILLFANNNLENSHIEFILTGSIISAILQNSFANSSSSIIMSKILGYVVDIIVPPIDSIQIIIAYIASSMLRGIIIGSLMFICINLFITIYPAHLGILLLITLMSSLLLGSLGLLSGIITNSFESSASITNYIVMPLSMLSGTFYSVKKLPLFLQISNKFNPFFYMIDGFRYGMLGFSDSKIEITVLILFIFIIIILFILHLLLRNGYGLQK